MALLQALLAMLGRSAGRVLNAIFGWAVRALFGAASGAQETLLSGLVAVAALWPLLLVGIVAPRVATWVLAFVPVSNAVSDGVLRAVWLGFALLVPALVGLAMAMKRPARAPRESAIVRAARGYPMTAGIAAAFLITFIAVPARRLRTGLRRHREVHVPLITSRKGYERAASRIEKILRDHGFQIAPRSPTFWMHAPLAILRTLGGDALRAYAPERLVYLAGPGIEAVLHPSSLLLRGAEHRITVAHGLVVEGLTATDAYQTTDAAAQDVERQIRNIWAKLRDDPRAHTNSPWLLSRLDEITAEIAQLCVSYDEWQIVYRQALQLARALHGEPQLLEAGGGGGGSAMAKGADAMSAEKIDGAEDASEIEKEIESLRSELSGLVGELDRRRHEMVDARLQVRRHPVAVALVGSAVVLTIVGRLTVARRRRARSIHMRALNLARALALLSREDPAQVRRVIDGRPKPSVLGALAKAGTSMIRARLGRAQPAHG